MSSSYLSTLHLDLTDSGSVNLKAMPNAYLFDSYLCGHICKPFWPADLGAEPDWFGTELDQLAEWWDAEQAIEDQLARHEMSLAQAEYRAMCLGGVL